MKHKKLLIGVLAIALLVGAVSAATILWFGQVKMTANVKQAVLLDGKDITGMPIEETATVAGGESFCRHHYLESQTSVPVDLRFDSLKDDAITVTYWKVPDTSGISIDGVMEDGEWGVPDFTNEGYFNVYVLEDCEYLYVAFEAAGGNYLPTGEGEVGQVGFMTATKPEGAFAWSYNWGNSEPTILGAIYQVDGVTQEGFSSGAIFAVKETVFELQVPLSELSPISLGDTVMMVFRSYSEGLTDWETCWLPAQGKSPLEYTIGTKIPESFTLGASERLDFCICYEFATNIEAGTYIITTTVEPSA